MWNPFSKLATAAGVPAALGASLPSYVAIADGLVISAERAQAWFVIEPAASQMLPDDERAETVARVISALQKILRDRQSQLKIAWAPLTAEAYTASIGRLSPWVTERADGIDALDLTERHVLIGIDIEDRTTVPVANALRSATEWLADDDRTIPRKERAFLDEAMRKLAAQLATSPWTVRPANVEMLAWMIASDHHRNADYPIPRDGAIASASLTRLVRGRMVPWPDHIRFYNEAGQETSYSTVLALTQFPKEIYVPGNGEWLLTLADIERLGEAGEDAHVPVRVQGDIRFEFLSQYAAHRLVNKVRKSAKEQRREAAASSAGETSLEIEVSEEEMNQLGLEIQAGQTQLVRVWPLITVSALTRQALDTSVKAVVAHYAERGIDAVIASDEQREAWLQGLACDQVRLDDLGHVMDAQAFFGSWFWGGSVVGDATGGAVGYTTGATQALVRSHLTEAPRLGDTATGAIVGRSGRGKTTLMQLMALDEADDDAWVVLFDFKGDLDNRHGGIVGCARKFGIHAQAADVGSAFAGAADLLHLAHPQQALSLAHSQLMMLISDALKVRAQPVLMEHIARLLETEPNARSTARLIERLAADEDDIAQRIARELKAYSVDIFGSAIVSSAVADDPLDTQPGIHLIRFPGASLPPAGIPADQWNTSQKVQAAVIRGFLAWTTQVASTPGLRSMRKLVCLPEAHLLTSTADGAAFLDQTARMGRALGVSLLIDTQDTASLANYPGIMEQIRTVYGFAQKTKSQQDGLAALLGLEPTDAIREQIADVNTGADGEVWHGHCIARDAADRLATVQICYPSTRVADLLDTSPHTAGKEQS